ncbi:hypothetical protein ERC79_01135 [Rhodococcus sp. ABRD24]|uniref:transglutaminase domain-containing protein n=1 Tax=Rhodococcus sp. ABRD24 TaxID=2507582 RepID=UPI00103E355A|nr:transglutaminase domain-containing protein [Rhodococcus sp. ABRD24]QBJ94723.1 hypothetical protein ERC79_01135 [Rhodococcus sp. ABRD24]
MVCASLTSWRGAVLSPVSNSATGAGGGTEATAILDWHHPAVEELHQAAMSRSATENPADFLIAAHALVRQEIRAVYALDEAQPASVTVRRGRGSCSQRLAVVEAMARRNGIATRTRGYLVRGEFWYPRFRRLRVLIPDRVLVAWPEFRPGGRWLDASAVFGPVGCESTAPDPFTNDGAETLFDALSRAPLSWRPADRPCIDLSGHVEADLGLFESRDALFAEYGQTIIEPVRSLIDPVFSRWGASRRGRGRPR